MAQKYDFYIEYVGPAGPHLNCLTEFTKTRDETKRGGDSIHPRVDGARTRHPKEDTRASPKASTKQRLIVALKGHVSRHPFDQQSVNRLARLSA